jgi:hypothetical protein
MQMPRFARHDPGAELIAERQDFLFRYVLPRYRGLLAWLAGNAYHLYKLVGLKAGAGIPGLGAGGCVSPGCLCGAQAERMQILQEPGLAGPPYRELPLESCPSTLQDARGSAQAGPCLSLFFRMNR